MTTSLFHRICKVALVVSTALPAAAQTPDASTPALPPQVLFPVSTSPSNGDLNPYGVAFVPFTVPVSGTQGLITAFDPGDLLISNFNNAATATGGNLQGTGTSIIRIKSNGQTSTFFQSPASLTQQTGQPGVGLTNALVVLKNGMVIVGSLPTTDGTFATVSAGSLLFIRRDGSLSTDISYQPSITGGTLKETTKGYVNNSFFNQDVIDGPWSLAVNDQGNSIQLFLSNVLTGTIVRFHVTFDSDGNGVIFDQYPLYLTPKPLNHQNDANGFLLGPSGLAYDPLPNSPTLDTLFIANSKDNAIYMLPGAAWTQVATPLSVLTLDTTHLHGPLGLALAPNGNLYVANSDGNNADPNQPSEIAIYDMTGSFQGQFSVDPQNGGAFGIAFQPVASFTRAAGRGSVTTSISRFAAVNDNFAPGNPLSLFKTPVVNYWTIFQ